jgi:hypothetical protein
LLRAWKKAPKEPASEATTKIAQVDLGSAEFDQHYRVYASPQRDDIWFHELFSPTFIVFLIEQAPKGSPSSTSKARSA